MKLFKKTAALLFCLALVLSVMAVSASADDEAQLLLGGNGVQTVVNNNFEVKLSRTPSDEDFNTGIKSRDNVTGVEIDPTDDVTFDITLFYKGTGAPPTIDALEFDYAPTDNDNAEITGAVIIYDDDKDPTTMANNNVTYAYSAEGLEDADIQVPTSSVTTGRVIGRITISFDSATQNKDIYPKIKNFQFTLRDNNETIQQPVAYSASAATPTNGGNGVTGTISNVVVPADGENPESTTTGCVIVATEPVIVNPIYTVTLKSIEPNPTSGILELKTASDLTLYYDFTHGSFVKSGGNETDPRDYMRLSTDAKINTIIQNVAYSGYTLQGWMVTEVSNNSETWAKYNGNWDAATSYPATTASGKRLEDTSVKVWGDDGWYSSTASTTDSRIDSGNSGVNFIPMQTLADNMHGYSKFWAHQVGNITLTPVYTRNVYTATFNAGANKATFGTNYVSESNASSADTWTKNYTIEDLYNVAKAKEAAAHPEDENKAYVGYEDFLELNDNNTGITVAAKGPQGLTRTAYKFMGWTISDTGDDVANAVMNNDYTWKVAENSNTVDGAGDFLVEASPKHYGNVTFTAQWEEDIYFAKIDYQYAGDGNALILVGVPADATTRDNYDANYTYYCKGVEMYRVPKLIDSTKLTEVTSGGTTCAQRTEYVKAALNATNPETPTCEKDYVSTFDTDIFGEAGAGKEYVIFAYISVVKTETQDENDTDVTDITITESAATSNLALAYDGDVDESNRVNVGDFGNVDTLLHDTEASNVFAITGDNGKYGVRARLQADFTTEQDATCDAEDWVFGSIKDIKGIYGKLGYIPSST